jgi:hypothetical protein
MVTDPRHPQILAWLVAHEHGFLVPELTAYSVIADLAVIDTDEMRAYEIKSSGDSLKRLPHQVMGYGRIFDRFTLVAAENQLRRLEKMEESFAVLPEWAGVMVVSEHGIEELRPASPNPDVCPQILAAMLWQDEAVAELRARGMETPRRRWESAHALSEAIPIDELRSVVRTRLKARNWTTRPPLRAGDEPTLRKNPAIVKETP